jgi:hypothetical protein
MAARAQANASRKNGAKGGRPPRLRVEPDEPEPTRPRAVYVAAARADSPVDSRLGLLRETARLLRKAEEAEAWTATVGLHKLACEQALDVRAVRDREQDARTDEDLARELAEITAKLPERLRVVGA